MQKKENKDEVKGDTECTDENMLLCVWSLNHN